MSRERVLLLGCGYIGSGLVDLLLYEGYRVLAVDNMHKGNLDHLIPFVPNPDFSFRFGDITNAEQIKEILEKEEYDSIVLMAGIVGFPATLRNPDLAYRVGIHGTCNILAYKHKDAKLIFTSTGSVYGTLGGNCNEESECAPPSLYGKYKLKGEKFCLQMENTIIHRYSTAFGVSHATTRVNLLCNTLVHEALTTKNLVIFEGDFKRSFVHVRDICNAILFTLENFDSLEHRLYNISNHDLNLSKKDLALKIQEKTGCNLTFVDNIQDVDKRNSFVDASRIYKEGWEPRISLDQGIDELIKVVPLLRQWDDYL